jgi:sulfoxide reductase heme-binding subunit YedZ
MTLWYLARGAGLAALIAFTASTALGALATTGRRGARGLDRRYLRQMAHRSAAVTGLLMLAVHVVLILTDVYVNVSLTGSLIPFTAGYRALAVGLGTISVYVFVLVAIAGAARGRLATSARSARNWRRIHLTAYAGWALSMGHGILAGTDTGTRWTTAIYLACGGAVALAVAVRLWSLRTERSHPLAVARARTRITAGLTSGRRS